MTLMCPQVFQFAHMAVVVATSIKLVKQLVSASPTKYVAVAEECHPVFIQIDGTSVIARA